MVVVGKALGQSLFFKMKSKGNGGDEGRHFDIG
jgi:hypothetical protein